MPYFKWKGYDQDFKYHEGVIESANAKSIIETLNDIGIRDIKEIGYEEYRRQKGIHDRIGGLEHLKRKLQPTPTQNKPRINWQPIIVLIASVAVICGILLLIAAAWLASR